MSASAPPNPVGLELQSIAFIISPSANPLAFPALALINKAPGATPRYSPEEPLPSPPMIPPTWVPCPTSSSSFNELSSVTKLRLSIMFKSG